MKNSTNNDERSIANECVKGNIYLDPISCEEIDITETKNVIKLDHGDDQIIYFSIETLWRNFKSSGKMINPLNKTLLPRKVDHKIRYYDIRNEILVDVDSDKRIYVGQFSTYGDIALEICKSLYTTIESFIQDDFVVLCQDEEYSLYENVLSETVKVKNNHLRLKKVKMTSKSLDFLKSYLLSLKDDTSSFGGRASAILSAMRSRNTTSSNQPSSRGNSNMQQYSQPSFTGNPNREEFIQQYLDILSRYRPPVFIPSQRMSDDDVQMEYMLNLSTIEELARSASNNFLNLTQESLDHLIDEINSKNINLDNLDPNARCSSILTSTFFKHLISVSLNGPERKRQHLSLVKLYIREIKARDGNFSCINTENIPDRIIKRFISSAI